MKFKVGQEVRLKGTKSCANNWDEFIGYSNLRKGDIVTIARIDNDEDIKIRDGKVDMWGGCNAHFREEDLMYVEDKLDRLKKRLKS